MMVDMVGAIVKLVMLVAAGAEPVGLVELLRKAKAVQAVPVDKVASQDQQFGIVEEVEEGQMEPLHQEVVVLHMEVAVVGLLVRRIQEDQV